jgi:hypothetical protein
MVSYVSEFATNFQIQIIISNRLNVLALAPHSPRTALDPKVALDFHNYIITPFPATYFVHFSFYSTPLGIP